MRVAHFALMSPNQAGLYGTVKDLILGERANGIEADFIDYGFEGRDEERILEDGWLKCVHWQEALKADIVIRHSAAPRAVIDAVPFMLALHGRPINTFLLSFNNGRKSPIIETIYQATERAKFKGFLTFWNYNTRIWNELLAPWPVYQIPAPVDLERFKPEGKKHKPRANYDFRILVADMWREDSCPVTPIFKALEAAGSLVQKEGIQVQVNAVGLPKRALELFDLIKQKSKNIHLGELFPMVQNIELLYRGADAVLTSHGLATRVVREAFACGTPVLTMDPSPDFRPSIKSDEGGLDIAEAIISLMMKGREETRRESRAYAEAAFDSKRTGAVIKSIFERVLQ